MINNSKKPTVDIKVKTDEIELSNLYDKLKLVFNYSFLKDIKSLKGTMNANFTLKGDLNKLKSNGFLKINNANLIADGVEIKNINSDIDFSNNIVNIVKAIGYVNNAPIIAKGKIDKNIDIELLMNKVELKYLCPKSLGIKSGVASLIANIYGTFDNITHKENLQIENFLVENDDINLLVDSIKMDTNKSNQIQISNVICKSAFADVIKAPMIRLFIEENGLKLPNTNIYLPNSKLIVKGSILDILKNFNFSLNANGFINSRDITYFKNYSNPYPVNISISGNKDVQNILSQILIEKTDIFDEPTVINLVSRLDKNTLKLEDLSLVNFTGKFSEDFKLNLKGQKKVIISGLIENLDELLIKNLRIFIPQQLNIKFQDTLAQLKGDVFVNGNFDKPEIVGQIAVNNLYNQTLQLAISNATLDFNKNNFIFNSPILKIADSTMGVNALVSTDLTNAITVKNLNVKSKYLNTDTILMYKDSPILNLYPIQINSGKFYSEKILANIYGSSLYLSGFNSDIELNDNIISLKNISSELFNGKLAGTLKYNLLDEHFDSKIQARGVSASPIFNIISTKKESISGTMDFDTNLIGELTSKQSLNGDIKFLVSNGRMSTLGKLEHLLYAQNILADNMLRTSLSVVTKAITLKDTGLFKYLRGEVELNNGIAKINLLQSQGPLMSLFIKGTYNPINDYAQLTVLGRLSDEVISGLGAFGEFSFKKLLIMLTGENNSYNIKLDDIEKLPQLPMKNTKEFRAIINGIIDKPSSVALFNWISYTEKSLKQKDVPMDNTPVPDFVEKLPY